MKSLVLLSGGLDSTVCLAKAIEDEEQRESVPPKVHALTFRYGSKHGGVELRAAQDVTRWYEVPWHILNLDQWWFGNESALLMGSLTEIPEGSYRAVRERGHKLTSIIPFRNGVFLSIAVAFAAARDFDRVYLATHKADGDEWAYPDCSTPFLRAFGLAAFYGTGEQVAVRFPFIRVSKPDVVREGIRLQAPMHLTWSCYNPIYSVPNDRVAKSEPPIAHHCGVCPTCIDRIRAFEGAELEDPTRYAGRSS